jgi:hypothetical protein
MDDHVRTIEMVEDDRESRTEFVREENKNAVTELPLEDNNGTELFLNPPACVSEESNEEASVLNAIDGPLSMVVVPVLKRVEFGVAEVV